MVTSEWRVREPRGREGRVVAVRAEGGHVFGGEKDEVM